MNYKEIKETYGIGDSDIANWFGYSNVLSFLNSPRKPNIENGIENLHKKLMVRFSSSLSGKELLDISRITSETYIKGTDDIHWEVRNIKNNPSKRTIEALKDFTAVIAVGNPHDIYKIIFVFDDWRCFYIATKFDQFTQSTIGKPNKETVLDYLKGPLSRFAALGTMVQEIQSYLGKEEFDKKSISLRKIEEELIKHNENSEKHNEGIKAFCLSIMG
jgi:hypothetical protein